MVLESNWHSWCFVWLYGEVCFNKIILILDVSWFLGTNQVLNWYEITKLKDI